MRTITEEEIEAERTAKGGWIRETLAEWGVPWPPPSGWKKAILTHGIPYQEEPATFPGRTVERRFSRIHEDRQKKKGPTDMTQCSRCGGPIVQVTERDGRKVPSCHACGRRVSV